MSAADVAREMLSYCDRDQEHLSRGYPNWSDRDLINATEPLIAENEKLRDALATALDMLERVPSYCPVCDDCQIKSERDDARIAELRKL